MTVILFATMDNSVKDKVIVVTGGAAGIGLAITNKFLEYKAKVVVVLDIDEESGHNVQKTLNSKYGEEKAIFMKCDVTKDLEEIYKIIIDKFKYVDVLVNNAGIADEESIRKTVDVNVVAVIEWSMKFLEHMRVDKGGNGGTIINMASVAGFKVLSLFPFYSASKFAVMGFTKSLGHTDNFAIHGVRIIAVCPGFTETDMAFKTKVTCPRALAALKDVVENKLWQKVEAVGEAAVQVYAQAQSGTAWVIEDGKLTELVA